MDEDVCFVWERRAVVADRGVLPPEYFLDLAGTEYILVSPDVKRERSRSGTVYATIQHPACSSHRAPTRACTREEDGQAPRRTFTPTSLMPSTFTHLRHLSHLPCSITTFSFLPAFGRVTVWKAMGGEKGVPLGDMPGWPPSETAAVYVE